ncbi:MAG: hypothetical protein AB9M53_00980 [Leptothrix sp. (in: b-proteobacteria)]
MKTNANVRSANRMAIVFDGKQIGALQSVRSSDDYGLEGVYGIGDIDPIEHVPSAARYTLSVSNVVLRVGAMRAAGLIPENGQDALKGLVFDIEQYDKDTGVLLRKYSGCSYASGDMDVSRNAIVMSNATFMALTVTGTQA